MSKITTPDSTPEELAELAGQVQQLALLLAEDNPLMRLLASVQSGQMSEQECLAKLMQMGSDGVLALFDKKP